MKDIGLNYESIGEGTPIFFQHGLGANLSQAQGLMTGLEGCRIVSMDCPGHGGSLLSKNYTPSFKAYTNDLLRLMDHLKIESAICGGISMGSGISLRMAIHHPDRVKGLILVRPAWVNKGKPANLEILLDLIEYLDKTDGMKEFQQTKEFKAIKVINSNAAKSVLGQFTREQKESTAQVLKQITMDSPFSNLAELKMVKQSSLVIVNDQDPLHPIKMGETIADMLPNCQLQTVTSRYRDNDHHTQDVTIAVASFLKQL